MSTIFYTSEDSNWAGNWVPDQLVDKALKDAVNLLVASANSKSGATPLYDSKLFGKNVNPELLDWVNQNPNNYCWVQNYALILFKRTKTMPPTKGVVRIQAEEILTKSEQWIRDNLRKYHSKQNTHFPNTADGFSKITNVSLAFKNLLKKEISQLKVEPSWTTGVAPSWIK